jgi:hypothetical protein
MLCAESSPGDYFPAYEVLLDELRDISLYGQNVHPSDLQRTGFGTVVVDLA